MLAVSQVGMLPWSPIQPYRYGPEYAEMGAWLDTHKAASARVACAEIGYLGFYSKRPIVDVYGLIHPEALPRIKRGEASWWFDENPPDVVVVHEPRWYGEPGAGGWHPERAVAFDATYHEVHRVGPLVALAR